MYDEQIKLKADILWSLFAKEAINPAVLPHAQVVSSLTIAVGLSLFFDQEKTHEKPLFAMQWNSRDVDNPKVSGHHLTQQIPC